MGRQVIARGAPMLSIEAHGTAEIEVVQVLRYSVSTGAFQIVFDHRPDTMDFTWTKADESFQEDSIYYMRLRQTGLVRDRIAMAWSSPIWVKHR
jgi:hypothetical protein